MAERIKYDACPLCSSPEIRYFHKGDCSMHPLYDSRLSREIIWEYCDKCAHVFTDGYYTDAACQLIYSKTNENQKFGIRYEQNRLISSRIVEKVLPYTTSGRWLDVGFGNGSLLLTAQEYGFKPLGLDLRKANVDSLRESGIEGYSVPIEELELPSNCSVISMMDVLEHIPYPRVALKAAYRLMDCNGSLLVSMPNTESYLWRTMTAQGINPYWGELEHYHNFSRTRLYQLLTEEGFVPVKYGISERYRICMEIVAVKSVMQQ